MTEEYTNYITSLDEFIRCIKQDTANWSFQEQKDGCPWFRGQDRENGPIPKLFRDKGYDEFGLTRMFRDRAGAFRETLEASRIDKWLFLMQHYGAPTRLLDWTESPLVALYFALDSYDKLSEQQRSCNRPTVWVLNPIDLNSLSDLVGFPNTWVRRDIGEEKDGKIIISNANSALERFRLSFHPTNEWKDEIKLNSVKLPVAVQTIYLDLRMYSQRSCFTIHGTEIIDLENLSKQYPNGESKYLLKYIISPKTYDTIFEDLKHIGINKATLFPDMSGLAAELSERFRNK